MAVPFMTAVERAEALFALEDQIQEQMRDIKRLRKKLEEREQTLRFYADKDNYKKPLSKIFGHKMESNVELDEGERARKVLWGDE